MYQLDGHNVATDGEGYLQDKQQWNEALVSVIAAVEQLVPILERLADVAVLIRIEFEQEEIEKTLSRSAVQDRVS